MTPVNVEKQLVLKANRYYKNGLSVLTLIHVV